MRFLTSGESAIFPAAGRWGVSAFRGKHWVTPETVAQSPQIP
jgi:hypothetical protein